MSSATISKDSKLYSTNELTPILNTVDFWLDMADSTKFTTLSASRINTITDKSATPKTITRTGTIVFDPTRKLIRPLGTTGVDYLTLSMATPNAISGFSETIIVVGYLHSISSGALMGGTNTGSRIVRISSTSVGYGRIGSTLLNSSSGVDVGKLFVISIVCYDGVPTIYYNGAFSNSGATTAVSVSEATQTILRGQGTTYPMFGGIGELLIFNTALNNQQRQQIEYYLFNKWKIDVSNLISSPLSISGGVDLWLDGNDASTITFSSGTSVSQWNDKSGNNRHATQVTVSKQPNYNSSTKALTYVNANATSLSSTCPYSVTETIFAVVNVPAASIIGTIVGSTNSARGREFRGGTNRGRITNNGTIIFTSFNTLLADADKHIIVFTNDASSNIAEMNINYIQDVDQSSIGFTAGSFTNLIGGSFSATGSFDSNIYEIIIFNRALPYTDKGSVIRYLMNKWSIPLSPRIPSTHTYYSIPPTMNLFTPANIENCNLWLDGLDLSTITPTTLATPITQWNDKSGNGFNATAVGTGITRISTGGLQLTSSSYFTLPSNAISPTASGSVTFIIVFNSTNAAGTLMSCGAATNIVISYNNSTGIVRSYITNSATTNIIDTLTPISFGTTGIYVYKYTLGGWHDAFANGVYDVTSTGTTRTIGIDSSRIAARYDNTAIFSGNIYEVIIYNRALNTQEIRQIESYLAQKWGLVNTLPGHLGRSGNYLSIDPRTVASNCALWLDASDPLNNSTLPSNASVLSTWYDKSGNTRNAVAGGTGPTFYTAGLNSKPSLLFSSNSLVSSGWNLAPSRQLAWFIVVNVTATTNAYQRVLIANGGQYFSGFFGTYANTANLLGIAGSTTFSAPVTTGTANPGIGTFAFGTSEFGSNVGAVNANGSAVVKSTGNTGAIGSNGVEIGFETGNAGAAFTGYISEIICYNGDVTQLQRQTIEAYLAQKWGLVSYLPSNHVGRMYRALNLPFDPRSIPACALWLDASDLSTITPGTIGATVTQWNDKSGNNLSALIGNYTLPTYNISTNNKPYINFDVNQSMFVANFPYNVTWNVFVAMNTTNLAGRWLISPYDTISLVMMGFNNNKIFPVLATQTDLSGEHIENTSAVNTNGTANNYWFRDGTQGAASGNVAQTLAATTLSLGIGANGRNADPLIGSGSVIRIYEIIIYCGGTNTLLSTAQRQRVEGYLAHKWGLQNNLPSNHPFKKIRP